MLRGSRADERTEHADILHEVPENVFLGGISIPDLRVDLFRSHIGGVEASSKVFVGECLERASERRNVVRLKDPGWPVPPFVIGIRKVHSADDQSVQRRLAFPGGPRQEVVDSMPRFVEIDE